ncbi:uncharacterized protein [Miscanthus floridulus]|uniref:uncharacterized protein n=1 Tax=Miscanthus floridulus TaxID=154761 RepID=UPI003458F393
MGLCMSSGAAGETTRAGAAPAPSKDTALVLMPSGEMREYPRPTTAARVLEDASATADGDSDWFLCDADGMGIEGAVAAVRDAEALRAGQIYFVLPAAARRRGLRREEVAALAVRASAALSSRAASAAAPGRRRRGAVVAPLVFAPPSEEDERAAAACKAAAAPPVRRPAPRVRSGRRLERFASDLTAIPEGERDDE